MPGRGLARKREAQALGLLIILVDDQFVAGRLTREVTIDDARHEQLFSVAALFQFVKDRPNCLTNECLILVRGPAALLELPLAFEKRGLVYEGEDIVERDLLDYARAEERSDGDRHFRVDV